MKKLFQILLSIAIANVVFLSGCKESTTDENPTSEFELLTAHLTATEMDLDHVIKSASGNKFVFAPSAVEDVAGKYIIDIRSADDFANGHIEGAVNVPVSDILTEAANAGEKQILVACYTGQTACFATSLLRLYGYHEAQALKWGMSGWNSETDKWTAKTGNAAEGKLTTAAAPDNVEYGNPTLNTGKADGESILKTRVETIVSKWGESTVSGTDVVSSPSSYFVNNYFSGDHYVGFGHIEGAVRVNPLKIGDGSIKFLDPDKPVVTYCYTGQTSAVITAFLKVLGYDAKSLTFGMNGLDHGNDFWTSGQVSNHWGANANPKDFPLTK